MLNITKGWDQSCLISPSWLFMTMIYFLACVVASTFSRCRQLLAVFQPSTQIIYSCVFCFMAAFSSLSSRSGVEYWFEKTRRNLGQPGEKWELARLEVGQERRAAVAQTWDRGRSTFWNDHHHCNHHRCQQCRRSTQSILRHCNRIWWSK